MTRWKMLNELFSRPNSQRNCQPGGIYILGGVRPSQKTRFYTSPEESEAQVKVISKFAELHALYGGMIARLTNSTRMAGSKLVDV